MCFRARSNEDFFMWQNSLLLFYQGIFSFSALETIWKVCFTSSIRKDDYF